MSNITRLWQAIRQSGQGVYQPALARQQLTVVSVETDSNGAVTAARGSIQGAGDFSVPVRGAGVRVGMLIGVTQPAHDPAAPLTFDGIDSTDDPSAGFSADDDADLPVPAWAGTPLTTAVEASPGRISSRVTAHFVPVSAKYKPSGYIVFYSLDAGTTWITMTTIDDDGSTAYAVPLSRSFEPGTSVEVKLRAVFKSGARSIASSTHTITAAADTTTPGTATTVTVDASVAGQLVCTVTASTITSSLWHHWRFEFSTSGSGPYSQVIETAGPATFIGTPGAWYVRVAPVSKADVVGTYTSWTGPTTLGVAAAPLDTTPPVAFGAPTLAQRSVTDANGTLRYFVKVTLPAYSFPSDYFETEVSLSDGTNPPLLAHITGTGTMGEWVVVPGTWTIGLRGVDQVGNRQSSFGTTANITVTPVGTPATMSAPTVTAKAGAMLIEWTRPTDAEWIRVTRATSAGGAGATVLGTFNSTAFLDILLTNGDVSGGYPTWYYATTAINLDSTGAIRAGTISSYTGAAVLATHGSWLGADTITAREILANTITANEIAATLTITGNTIRTAGSGARVELDGPNNRLGIYGASALLAYLNGTDLRFLRDGNTAHPRSKFDTNGIYLYNDSDQLRTQLTKDGLFLEASGGGTDDRIFINESGGSMVLSNYLLDLSKTQFWHRLYRGTIDYVLTSGSPQKRFTWSNSGDSELHLTASNAGMSFYLDDAAHFVVADGDMYVVSGLVSLSGSGSIYLQHDGTNFNLNSGPLRILNADGATTKIQHTGTGGNAQIDWSHGALYLGWTTNPSNQVIVGNGASGYGPILASAFTVSSDRQHKRDIRPVEAIGAAFDRLAVRRYARVDDAPGTERIGFVADEVAALFPEVVIDSGLVPDGDVVPDGKPIITDTIGIDGKPVVRQPMRQPMKDGGQAVDLYALISLTTAALQETRAELSALRADVATLKSRPH